MNDLADVRPGPAPGGDLDLLELERAERREQVATTGRGLRRLAAATAITIDAETTQWRQRLGRHSTSRAPVDRQPEQPTRKPRARSSPRPKPQPQPHPARTATHPPRRRTPSARQDPVRSPEAVKARPAQQAKLLRQAEEADRIGRDEEQWRAWASMEVDREDGLEMLDRRRPGRLSRGRPHRPKDKAPTTDEMPVPVPVTLGVAPHTGGLRSRVTAAIDRWADREAAVADRLEGFLSPKSPTTKGTARRQS